jgi:hypothetical protein
MAKLHNILKGCRDHVRKIVYAVEPAALDEMGERWHAHNTDSGKIQDAAQGNRIFDVFPMATGPVKITEGSNSWDYEVPFIIVISYGTNENYNELIASDFASISHALHNANVAMVSGLNFYMVQGMAIEEQEGKRFSVINFIARVTATFDNLTINDPGGFGGDTGFGGI